jgi:hypothetical protein
MLQFRGDPQPFPLAILARAVFINGFFPSDASALPIAGLSSVAMMDSTCALSFG